ISIGHRECLIQCTNLAAFFAATGCRVHGRPHVTTYVAFASDDIPAASDVDGRTRYRQGALAHGLEAWPSPPKSTAIRGPPCRIAPAAIFTCTSCPTRPVRR